MEAAIKVEGLSKRYELQHQANPARRYTALRDVLAERFAAIFSRKSSPSSTREEFWALRDVTFEVARGDAVAIIGRNGAGKSTLLKLLSRITRPTTGRIEIEGHVASLLEVGTGFHPELTGRENIYLNGAILGMPRAEVRRKFDEIVSFAEVERFVDLPVKRYSSGMYMRLAFAVAAHLDPEILIVDEVLAVGDAQFQKKCLGKMEQVSCGGRTVLFVSHNLAAVRALCKKGVLLKQGRVAMQGGIQQVADAYAAEAALPGQSVATVSLAPPTTRASVWPEEVTVLVNERPAAVLPMGARLALEVRFRAERPIALPVLGLAIRSAQGATVLVTNNYFQPSPEYSAPVETGVIRCDLGVVPLMPDQYSFSLWLCRDPHEQCYSPDAIWFGVEEHDAWGLGRLPPAGMAQMWWPSRFELNA